MKKSFPLHVPGKADPRVIDGIKAEIGKYLKRERRKTLPEGADLWDFDCKVGVDQLTAETKTVAELNQAVDAVIHTGAESVYLEILAKAGAKPPRPPRSFFPRSDDAERKEPPASTRSTIRGDKSRVGEP